MMAFCFCLSYMAWVATFTDISQPRAEQLNRFRKYELLFTYMCGWLLTRGMCCGCFEETFCDRMNEHVYVLPIPTAQQAPAL